MEKHGLDVRAFLVRQFYLEILEMERLLKIDEVCEMFGTSQWFVLKRISANFAGPKLAFYRVGNGVRFKESDVTAYLENLRNAPSPAQAVKRTR